jgi:hypothetical protein
MMIMLHVAIALTSLIISLIGVMRPSRRLLNSSYGLIVGTVASGVMLAIVDQKQILHVCMSGFSYLLIASALTYVMYRRVEQSTAKV